MTRALASRVRRPLGFTFAIINMALFTGYVIVAHRISRHRHLAGRSPGGRSTTGTHGTRLIPWATPRRR